MIIIYDYMYYKSSEAKTCGKTSSMATLFSITLCAGNSWLHFWLITIQSKNKLDKIWAIIRCWHQYDVWFCWPSTYLVYDCWLALRNAWWLLMWFNRVLYAWECNCSCNRYLSLSKQNFWVRINDRIVWDGLEFKK